MKATLTLLTALLLAPLATTAAAPSLQGLMPRAGDYTLMWWADGPPHGLGLKGAAAQRLCFQTGRFGFMLDAERLRLPHAGRLKENAVIATATIEKLPAMDLELALVVNGQRHVCTGRANASKDLFFFPVRFVESGRFFQRVEIVDLAFERLTTRGRLEIAVWPDRATLRLESEGDGRPEIAIGGRSAAGVVELFAPGNSAEPRVTAESGLTVTFDETLGCHRLALPETPWSNAKGTYYPVEHLDRLDRWRFTAENLGDRETLCRLMFTQERHLPITGFTPMICDSNGAPTGLAVQISKNWHTRPEKGRLRHEGPWFHGCAVLRLPPRSRQTLTFQMVYARYGGVPAASHAQLSLIGWGHNQFWDQCALGSFGESICYEPGRVQRRCFITDVRPLMTLGRDGGPWSWAENCGGGDFLIWIGADGQYRGFRGTRAAYRAQGPCLTDVGYVEETADGAIGARMDVAVARSDDYLRAFHHVRYDVRRPVRWQRLAFFQMGADFYNDTPSRRVAVGDATGLREEWTPAMGKDVYDRRAVPLTGNAPWVSAHGLERESLRKGAAAASRGLIVRSWKARLGGRSAPVPHVATYATEWHRGRFRTVVELAPPPGVTALQPGDYVETNLEFVVLPADAAAYYGPNEKFREVLAKDADTWRPVHREAAGNALRVHARRGSVQQTYPLRIRAAADGTAEFEVSGGVGHVPVTFTGLRDGRPRGLLLNGSPLNQTIHGNDFWQTDYDALTRRWSQTYNLPVNDDKPHVIRFERKP
jgi:hypothetical protein